MCCRGWFHPVFVAATGAATYALLARSVELASPEQPTRLGAQCREALPPAVVAAQALAFHAVSCLYALWFSTLPDRKRVHFDLEAERKLGRFDLNEGSTHTVCGCAPSVGALLRLRRVFFVDVAAALVVLFAAAARDPPAQVVAGFLLFLAVVVAAYHIPLDHTYYAGVPYYVVAGGCACVWLTCSTAWSAQVHVV